MDQQPFWKSHEFWSKCAAQAIVLAGAGYAVYSGHQMTPEQKIGVCALAGKLFTSVEGIYHFAGSIKNKLGGQPK